jgi:2Fe-2S iron-sulfur cluster binding domain
MQRSGALLVRRAGRLLRSQPAWRPARRNLRASPTSAHGYSKTELDPATVVNVVFVGRDGEELKVSAPEGKNLLEIAHANEIDLEGACEGSLACRYALVDFNVGWYVLVCCGTGLS